MDMLLQQIAEPYQSFLLSNLTRFSCYWHVCWFWRSLRCDCSGWTEYVTI